MVDYTDNIIYFTLETEFDKKVISASYMKDFIPLYATEIEKCALHHIFGEDVYLDELAEELSHVLGCKVEIKGVNKEDKVMCEVTEANKNVMEDQRIEDTDELIEEVISLTDEVIRANDMNNLQKSSLCAIRHEKFKADKPQVKVNGIPKTRNSLIKRLLELREELTRLHDINSQLTAIWDE